MERTAQIYRQTRETEITLALNLDGTGSCHCKTGVPFMDHMLHHVAMHSLFDLEIKAQGDLEIDAHHTIEDLGIVLGQALAQALGDKRGIVRYGYQILPMDEALVLVALDISGRGLFHWEVTLPAARVGAFDTELVPEFLRALAHNAGLTLHVRLLNGSNTHHIIEAIFKALGRALGQATTLDPRRAAIPSTKGVL